MVKPDFLTEKDILENLCFKTYRLKYRAPKGLEIDAKFGVRLHKTFGAAMSLTDQHFDWKNGHTYSLFHPKIGQEHPLFKKHKEGIPGKWVFSAPPGFQKKYQSSEILCLDITCFGHLADKPGILTEFSTNAAKQGFDKHNTALEFLSLEKVFDFPKDMPKVEKGNIKSVCIKFDTPVNIDDNNTAYIKDFPFHVLYHRLFVRLYHLAVFHCGYAGYEKDNRTFKNKDTGIRLVDKQLHKEKLWYSKNSQTRQKEGLQGYLHFQGELVPYLKILRLGQYVHVGREIAFGCGKYTLFYEK